MGGTEGASPSVVNSPVIGLVAFGDEISRLSFQDGALCWLQLQALPIWAVSVMKQWRRGGRGREESGGTKATGGVFEGTTAAEQPGPQRAACPEATFPSGESFQRGVSCLGRSPRLSAASAWIPPSQGALGCSSSEFGAPGGTGTHPPSTDNAGLAPKAVGLLNFSPRLLGEGNLAGSAAAFPGFFQTPLPSLEEVLFAKSRGGFCAVDGRARLPRLPRPLDSVLSLKYRLRDTKDK